MRRAAALLGLATACGHLGCHSAAGTPLSAAVAPTPQRDREADAPPVCGLRGWEGSKDAERDARAFLATHPVDAEAQPLIEALRYFASHLRPEVGFDAMVCDLLGRPASRPWPAGRAPLHDLESLGFGARAFGATLDLVHGGCRVRVAGYVDRVVEVEAWCYAFSETKWSRLAPAFRAVFPGWVEEGNDADIPFYVAHSLAYRWRDDGALAAMDSARAVSLGPLTGIELPADLRWAYERLMGPSKALEFVESPGTQCSIGIPPLGRGEMDQLVAAGRYDLIRNVLRGPVSAARAYAAYALKTQGRLEERDLETLAALRGSDGVVDLCNGCAGTRVEPESGLAVFRP